MQVARVQRPLQGNQPFKKRLLPLILLTVLVSPLVLFLTLWLVSGDPIPGYVAALLAVGVLLFLCVPWPARKLDGSHHPAFQDLSARFKLETSPESSAAAEGALDPYGPNSRKVLAFVVRAKALTVTDWKKIEQLVSPRAIVIWRDWLRHRRAQRAWSSVQKTLLDEERHAAGLALLTTIRSQFAIQWEDSATRRTDEPRRLPSPDCLLALEAAALAVVVSDIIPRQHFLALYKPFEPVLASSSL